MSEGHYEKPPLEIGRQAKSRFTVTEKVTIGISILAVFMTALSATFTGWQAHIAEVTREDAVDAAKRQDQRDRDSLNRQERKNREQAAQQATRDKVASDALAMSQRQTERSARAAEQSAQVARESLFEQRRSRQPRVVRIETTLTKPLAVDIPFQTKTVFINEGQSLAENVYTTNWVRSDYPDQMTFEYKRPLQGLHSKTIMGTGAGVELLSNPMVLTTIQLNAVNGGQTILYTYGYVDFQDEHNLHHCLTYCSEYDPTKPDLPWGSCWKHNEFVDRPCE